MSKGFTELVWLPEGVIGLVSGNAFGQYGFPLTRFVRSSSNPLIDNPTVTWKEQDTSAAITYRNAPPIPSNPVDDIRQFHFNAAFGLDLAQVTTGDVSSLFNDAYEEWTSQNALISGQVSRGGRFKAQQIVVPLRITFDRERALRQYAYTTWNGLGSLDIWKEQVRSDPASAAIWDRPDIALNNWRRGFHPEAEGYIALTPIRDGKTRLANTTRIARARITDVTIAVDSDPTAEDWDFPAAVTFVIDNPRWITTGNAGVQVAPSGQGSFATPTTIKVHPPIQTFPVVRIAFASATTFPLGAGIEVWDNPGSQLYRLTTTAAITIPSAGVLIFETDPRRRGLYFESSFDAVTGKAGNRTDHSSKLALDGRITPAFTRGWQTDQNWAGQLCRRYPYANAVGDYRVFGDIAASRPF